MSTTSLRSSPAAARARRLSQLVVAWAFVGFGALAEASPWVLRPGSVVLGAGLNHQRAREEFLDEGGSRPFPLDGHLEASSLLVSARAGLFDGFEMELRVPFTTVSYQSDPVIILPGPAGGSAQDQLDYYQENVLDLSQSVSGISDIYLAARYALLRSPLAIATELALNIPTGYDAPAGTFGERPQTIEEFQANVADYTNSNNVEDDVTLGDGQLDIRLSVLVGWALDTGTFFRFDGGYNLQTDGAGDQLVGELKIGQALSRWVLVYVGARGGYAIQDGRVIGVSISAIDPELPAEDYGGFNNLLLREVTLDRDYLDIGGGLILRLNRELEINLGYEQTVIGRNISAVQSFSMSMVYKTSFFED